jgi:hypothetical protein
MEEVYAVPLQTHPRRIVVLRLDVAQSKKDPA